MYRMIMAYEMGEVSSSLLAFREAYVGWQSLMIVSVRNWRKPEQHLEDGHVTASHIRLGFWVVFGRPHGAQ